MKTKPISIRFEENDLALAINLSGVKKPQRLVDLLISEYVKHLKGTPIELPKDYMQFNKIGVIDVNGKIEPITVTTPAKTLSPYLQNLQKNKLGGKK